MKQFGVIVKLLFRAIKKLFGLKTNKQYTTLLDFHDILSFFNPFLSLFIKKQPFFDINHVSNTQYLEAKWEIIRKELSNLLKERDKIPSFEEVDEIQKYLTSDRRWKTFFLKIYGNWIEKNCAKCSQTAEIIEKVPGVHTAMFSILDGHKHIPRHTGVFKGVLRYHLGLFIPNDKQCRIEVDSETKYWKEGKGLLFDDTLEHEVWNDSDEERIVLFLDIERPLPYKWLQKLNKKILKILKTTDYIQKSALKA